MVKKSKKVCAWLGGVVSERGRSGSVESGSVDRGGSGYGARCPAGIVLLLLLKLDVRGRVEPVDTLPLIAS